MRKAVLAVVVGIALVVLLSNCSGTQTLVTGKVAFNFDLSGAKAVGYNITNVHITLTHENGMVKETDLTVDASNNRAYGVIDGLRIGTWNVLAELYENETEVGSGSTNMVIEAGRITNVTIYITLATGAASINVVWNTEYTNLPELFRDDFNSLDNWILFGNPLPVIRHNVYGRESVFDNNGDANYASGAYSRRKFSLHFPIILEAEIYTEVSDWSGCWNEPLIGLAVNDTSEHLNNGIIYVSQPVVGDACWGAPTSYRRHAYFSIGYKGADGEWEKSESYSLLADEYLNGWHRWKIYIGEDRKPEFYVDDNLVYKAATPMTATLDNVVIVLGNRSSGSAGKSYHDWIRLLGQQSE